MNVYDANDAICYDMVRIMRWTTDFKGGKHLMRDMIAMFVI